MLNEGKNFLFTREIMRTHGAYKMLEVEKIGNFYLCFDESTGYFLAAPRLGHVCEISVDDYLLRDALIKASEAEAKNA